MDEAERKARTKQFAIDIITFARTLPTDAVSREIVRRLVKSGGSVGANYRGSCGARSPAEFIARPGVVEEEADETSFWLEVLVDDGTVTKKADRALSRRSRSNRSHRRDYSKLGSQITSLSPSPGSVTANAGALLH